MPEPLKPPADLKPRGRGRKFVRSLEVFELRADEAELALEAARRLDLADELRKAVEREGLTAEGSMGQTVVHPLLAELRATRAELRQTFRQLGLPDPATGETDVSRSARAAAEARWSRRRSA
jgi:hypothetical protein